MSFILRPAHLLVFALVDLINQEQQRIIAFQNAHIKRCGNRIGLFIEFRVKKRPSVRIPTARIIYPLWDISRSRSAFREESGSCCLRFHRLGW